MSGRSSQSKGARGEFELTELLQQYGYTVQRGGSETYGTVPDITGLPIYQGCRPLPGWIANGLSQEKQKALAGNNAP